MNTSDVTARKVNPRIGLLPTGHFYYWDQFPDLKAMGQKMQAALLSHLESIGEVVCSELVDTMEKSVEAGAFFKTQEIDILIVFPFGYTPGMCVVPAVKDLTVPIRIMNAHEDSSYDYPTADTTIYLHHEGVCCIPEYAGALVNMGMDFKVRTGHFGEQRLWDEIGSDCMGAAAAREFRKLNFGIIGDTYTNMADMQTDESRLMRKTGKLLLHPEVEEIEEAYNRVTNEQVQEMLGQFREMYEVDPTVTDEHMWDSARIAVAYDEIICKYDISAFGYYWWGVKENITILRSQSALAVSRLASLGRPGVTEGDVKTAMAMKIMDLLGAGGMFLEFFSMDFDENFLLMGHDGPSNINMADGSPKLQHLEVHHGKSGHGLGIDFDMKQGPVTMLNLTQFGCPDNFRLIYSVGEVVQGEILSIGNPNCRVRIEKPIHQFMDDWCQQGPSHHLSLGLGDLSQEIEAFAEAIGFECIRI
jgi:L-arabinose isomerase